MDFKSPQSWFLLLPFSGPFEAESWIATTGLSASWKPRWLYGIRVQMVARATIAFYPVFQIIVSSGCRGKILVVAAVVAYYLKLVLLQASMPLSHCPCVVRLPRCLPEAVVPVLSMLLWKAHQQKFVWIVTRNWLLAPQFWVSLFCMYFVCPESNKIHSFQGGQPAAMHFL